MENKFKILWVPAIFKGTPIGEVASLHRTNSEAMVECHRLNAKYAGKRCHWVAPMVDSFDDEGIADY